MKRGGYLKRYTSLARKALKPKRSEVPPEEREARRLVYARSGGRCEGCASARATDWHHRKNRSQGGLWAASNGLHLCRQCHQDVTSPAGERREFALDTGRIVLSHEDPAEVPVTLPQYGPVLLTDDGGLWPADLEPIHYGEEMGA